MILHYGVVNGCIKSNSCSYMRNPRGGGNMVFFPKRWKDIHSLVRTTSLISSNMVLMLLGGCGMR